MKKALYQIMPPCARCPYQLGIIKAVMNPCLQCRLNGYVMYEKFKEQVPHQSGTSAR